MDDKQNSSQNSQDRSGDFKSLDYFVEDGVILRHFIDFENFPDYKNRWVLIKNRNDIGKEDSFISESEAEVIMEIALYIEEIEGTYFAANDEVKIKSSKDHIDNKGLHQKLLKKEALLGEHTIEWYLFRAKDGTPYLCSNRDSGNEALYELDKNRKWKPVHNASAFDGFKKADAVFESIVFSYNGKKITIK